MTINDISATSRAATKPTSGVFKVTVANGDFFLLDYDNNVMSKNCPIGDSVINPVEQCRNGAITRRRVDALLSNETKWNSSFRTALVCEVGAGGYFLIPLIGAVSASLKTDTVVSIDRIR